ncbi:hypothetical protein NDU88_001962 [Pleurodeles waltl]|uniref:Uncharacterized protein n=1 Tax=Pleurodeles waltl TaxID=8319 RepID=A0AAV7RAJ9_PLEWA|nr:hypothetical protein NDU88_001962 [Pleurodeles waltl]
MLLQCRYIVSCERGCRRRLRPAGELPQHCEVSLVGEDASRLRYAAAILLSVPTRKKKDGSLVPYYVDQPRVQGLKVQRVSNVPFLDM